MRKHDGVKETDFEYSKAVCYRTRDVGLQGSQGYKAFELASDDAEIYSGIERFVVSSPRSGGDSLARAWNHHT